MMVSETFFLAAKGGPLDKRVIIRGEALVPRTLKKRRKNQAEMLVGIGPLCAKVNMLKFGPAHSALGPVGR